MAELGSESPVPASAQSCPPTRLAFPLRPERPHRTHHGPAGCPWSSSTLGSPASFLWALALSSWARAPSSRARCRHDFSSENVTFEEACGHKMPSAGQSHPHHSTSPTLGPDSLSSPGWPGRAADLLRERPALGSQEQPAQPGQWGQPGQPGQWDPRPGGQAAEGE